MSRAMGREIAHAVMRCVTDHEKSQGAVIAHLIGLGYDVDIAISVLESLIRKGALIEDTYGRVVLDRRLMKWRKVRGGVTLDGRSLWKRWNGERFEQVLSARPTKPNPASKGARAASREDRWLSPSALRRMKRLPPPEKKG